jgi:hypothetical protein
MGSLKRTATKEFAERLKKGFTHKLWLERHAPNIKLFDYIMNQIVKIATKHPYEVL